jgi:hypothetical protein
MPYAYKWLTRDGRPVLAISEGSKTFWDRFGGQVTIVSWGED